MKNQTSSEIRNHEMVTTINRLGGIGIGYLVEGQVWKTTGSYWAVKAEDDVFGMTQYHQDGGRMYRQQAEKILG